MINLQKFFLIFSLLKIQIIVKGNQCDNANFTYVKNLDPSLPTCLNTYGCLWDLSQCSQCKYNECVCQSYNDCDSCKSGFFFNENTELCQECPEGCAICCQRESLTEYICSQCQRDYTLVGGICINTLGCKQLIPNTNKCLSCIDGYYLDQSSKCQKCHDNCRTCLTKYDCITCNSVYSNVPAGNICVGNVTPTPPKPQIPDCIFKDEESKYGTSSNVDEITNCLSRQLYSLDISTGRCKCTQCIQGNFLVSYVDNNTQLLSYSCNSCNIFGNNNIKKCIQDLSQTGRVIIIECEDGYVYDLYYQQCVNNSQIRCRRLFKDDCSDCYDNFYPELDIETQRINCYLIQVDGCLVPISKGKNCTQCDNGYYLENDYCYHCNQGCTTDSCMTCSKCQSATQCLQCNSGYRLKNGICNSCINPYCAQCAQVENVCTKCKPGYGLNTQSKDDSDQCIQCQNDCLVCDVDFRKCTQCSEGFYIHKFICKKQPDNCVLQQNGFCIKCAFGYIAQAGYCIKCSNDYIGYYACPSQCDDSQIQLVDLLHSKVLENSILFQFLVYFGFVLLPLINFR
ncbi:hypothetical protein ABPG72_001567 [Tetrahymena utriculariae]